MFSLSSLKSLAKPFYLKGAKVRKWPEVPGLFPACMAIPPHCWLNIYIFTHWKCVGVFNALTVSTRKYFMRKLGGGWNKAYRLSFGSAIFTLFLITFFNFFITKWCKFLTTSSLVELQFKRKICKYVLSVDNSTKNYKPKPKAGARVSISI